MNQQLQSPPPQSPSTSESSPKYQLKFIIVMGAMCLWVGTMIYFSHKPKYAPKAAQITHYAIQFKDPGCYLRARLILNGRTQSNMDPGDEFQQSLWKLADQCHASVIMEKDNELNNPGVPKGPDRNG